MQLEGRANSLARQPQPACLPACLPASVGVCGAPQQSLVHCSHPAPDPTRPTLALCPLQDRACPSCGSQLSLKFSSKSRVPFVGCSTYPGMALMLRFGGADAGCVPLVVPCPTGGAACAPLPHPALNLLPCRVQLSAPHCRRVGHWRGCCQQRRGRRGGWHDKGPCQLHW